MPFKIVKKEQLSDNMFRVTFHAPLVARRAQPGQFLMFRVDEFGERMPITISYFDREAGDVTVIMQRVGSTTALLASMNEGDYVADVVGPLGKLLISSSLSPSTIMRRRRRKGFLDSAALRACDGRSG